MTSIRHWWSDAVVYQLYVRSFADSNSDGKGDLAGIRSRLPYLQQLGVDAIWLNPCYPSPQRDHGYDVSDYFDIEPDYGTLDDFDALVATAAEHGIKVLMDVIPNHCSDQHPWFQAALAAGPGSPERSRFWFRDGSGPDGSEPPNNWQSIFGGSSWSRVTEADGTPGQWYLHMFDSAQPDLNWDHPDVPDMFDDMLRFWFDRGVEGIRADAVAVLGKEDGLPDYDPSDDQAEIGNENPYHTFHPSGHAAWRRWRTTVDRYIAEHPGRDPLLICEAYTPDGEVLAQYVNEDEFDQCFSFGLMMVPWDTTRIRAEIDDVLETLLPRGLWPAWTLNNHDAQRAVTRRGRADAATVTTGNNLLNSDAPVDLELGTRRARAMTLLALALPGSIYLYNGEELALPEVLDLPADARQDPVFRRTEGRELGRDGCRVPLPWTSDPDTAFGFSDEPGASPWLPQPADWSRYAADRQAAEPGSALNFYRAAIAKRRALDHFAGRELTWLDSGDDRVLAFARGEVIVAINVSSEPVALSGALADADLAISSGGPVEGGLLPGDTAVWLQPRS